MSDSIIQCIMSVIGKDVNIDTFQKGTRTFYNATKLWKHLGSDPRKSISAFVRLHHTRDCIVFEYGKLVDKDQTIEKIATDSYSCRKPVKVPTEILDVFIMSGFTKESTTYLEETLFIMYAKHISTDISIAIINTYLKYSWIEALSPAKRSDALIDAAVQEEIKHLGDEFVTRGNGNKNNRQ